MSKYLSLNCYIGQQKHNIWGDTENFLFHKSFKQWINEIKFKERLAESNIFESQLNNLWDVNY